MEYRIALVALVVCLMGALMGGPAEAGRETVYLPLVANGARPDPRGGGCDGRPCEIPPPMSLLLIGYTPESLERAICVIETSFMTCWPER